MAKRKNRKQLVESNGTKAVVTGMYHRYLSEPAPIPELSRLENAYVEALLDASKEHPNDPQAIRLAALSSLSPKDRKTIIKAGKKSSLAAKRLVQNSNRAPNRTWAGVRSRCLDLVEKHGAIVRNSLPEFTWENGTQSIMPDPNDLQIEEEVRDACEVLKQLHGTVPTFQTLMAFLAGMAYTRMLTRPFERYVFDGKKQLDTLQQENKRRAEQAPTNHATIAESLREFMKDGRGITKAVVRGVKDGLGKRTTLFEIARQHGLTRPK